MELSKQVVSLELAKKLKELGVKQESLFFWKPDGGWHLSQKLGQHAISAFTVAELGEMLPKVLRYPDIWNEIYLSFDIFRGLWLYSYGHYFSDDRNYEKTEADARANMLIYLLENKLITSPTLQLS